MRLSALSLSLVAVIATGARAQGIPFDDHIVSSYRSVTSITLDGLFLASVKSKTCRPITGLTTRRGSGDVNAVQLDPATGDIWIGGYGATAGQLDVITLNASAVVSSWRNWGRAGPTAATSTINAITFDDNGNPITAAGDGIYRFDRFVPGDGVSILSTASSTWAINAICRDPAGNLYFGQSDGGLYMMAKNPDCTYGAATLLGNVNAAAGSPMIAGIEYSPAPQPLLYWVVDGGTGGVGTFALPAGPAKLVAAVGVFGHAIEFDANDNEFSLVDHSVPARVRTLSLTNATSTACMLPSGIITSGIDTHDGANGQVTVLPACPPRDSTFTLELAVCCPPGTVAAIFVSAPSLGVAPQLVISNSSAPASGRVSTRFTKLVAPPSLPANTLVFSSGCLDVNSGALSLGQPVSWPAH